MSASYEHPSLKLYVTDEQRQRAEQWLQSAYADGRLTEEEFDQRIGQVISAVTRRDLNQAFYGLVQVSPSSSALGIHPAYSPMIRPEVRQQAGHGAAALAHFSVFFLWLLGPLLFFGGSTPGSYVRREAAKAFNFQFLSTLSFIGLAIVNGVVGHLGFLFPLMALAWFVLTIIGGARALQGDDWPNPVKKALRFEVLKEQ
jgi:uncharacterized Tic20 family protein